MQAFELSREIEVFVRIGGFETSCPFSAYNYLVVFGTAAAVGLAASTIIDKRKQRDIMALARGSGPSLI